MRDTTARFNDFAVVEDISFGLELDAFGHSFALIARISFERHSDVSKFVGRKYSVSRLRKGLRGQR